MNTQKRWGEKPYHSLDYAMRQRFGEKVYKVSLESGLTCPNRDGTLDTRGCIFCSGMGSGDFASPRCGSITAQIEHGIEGLSSRKSVGNKFIAYFQSFTNTYGPVEKLQSMWQEALAHDSIVGLSIATRPDCLSMEVLDLLEKCNEVKPVMVELGLQTIYQKSSLFIRRGYELSTYDTAVTILKSRGIEVITHVIAGLPWETKEDFLSTVRYVGDSGADGIKLQLLHVLKGTDLADYIHDFHVLSEDEYVDWIVEALATLPPEIVIHRLTGDGPKDLLIAPLWSSHKRQVLNHIHAELKARELWQGKYREG